MKVKGTLSSAALILLSLFYSCTQKTKDTVERIDQVEALIAKMTVEEKVGQMTQVTLDVITKGKDIVSSYEPVELDPDSVQMAIQQYHVGSFLNTANNRAQTLLKWKEIVGGLQKVARNDTRLKIPIIYGVDAIHGATYTAGATLFPQQIAQAATWNRALVNEAAKITAYEVRASSVRWNFSPVLDLGLDPRWPRQWETFGEDPFLCAEMGEQVIHGYQGENLGDNTSVASCMKHFLGYSAANSGKDRTPSEISDVALREYHLGAFKRAIDAGSATIMINSGIINGTPVHANYDILTKLLKEELGFNGLVVTDWADIENLYQRDKVVSSHKEAIKLSINAGIDMSMVPYNYTRYCKLLTELVNEGEIPMSRIDDAVRRVLNLKYKLGLFNGRDESMDDYPKFASESFEKASFSAAAEAITLLKNENKLLPLEQGVKILVTGPNANNMRSLNGGWSYSWQGEKVAEFADKYHTFYDAIRNKFGEANVNYVAGLEYNMDGKYWEEQNLNIKGAVDAAKKSDVVVLCLGENSYTEKPGDLNDLTISENQIQLAKALSETGKPIILVLNEGRPRIINAFAEDMDAILQTYLSGNFAGDALAEILSGDINPSGKLPYTYPRYPNSLVVYNHKPSQAPATQEGMYDYGGGFTPQFQFGFGLSYTTFEYSDLKVSSSQFANNESITITVKVKNTGSCSGKEVVQLFSSDLFASVTPDVKRLRGFEKVTLFPGEEIEVAFTLSAKDVSFINKDQKRVAEAGDFNLIINNLHTKVTLLDTSFY